MTFGAVFPRVLRPPFGPVPAPAAGGVDWSAWFDHFWQAKGAASQAASYLDLVGSADLTEGVAPTWASGSGWAFGAAGQYLNTGVTPTSASTLVVAFLEFGTTSGDPALAGAYDSATARFFVLIHRTGGSGGVSYGNGNYVTVSPGLANGVLAVAGVQGYRNGSAEGSALSGMYDKPWSIYLGGLNINDSIYSPGALNCEIHAVGIRESTMSSDDVAAASAAMAAL